MTTKKEQGISVVRVPRQLLNPTNPIDNQNDTDKDLSNNHLKPPHIVHIGKISPNKNEQSVRKKFFFFFIKVSTKCF
jgi:hypothetical protein